MFFIAIAGNSKKLSRDLQFQDYNGVNITYLVCREESTRTFKIPLLQLHSRGLWNVNENVVIVVIQ
ncbi:MAG: hypothetical protein AYK18_13930 [Theionarchaea archaeon DG-70]|nr:MAG: hypothetical protein AYK18_13930 [Theionarchaea archaeon DG-70]